MSMKYVILLGETGSSRGMLVWFLAWEKYKTCCKPFYLGMLLSRIPIRVFLSHTQCTSDVCTTTTQRVPNAWTFGTRWIVVVQTSLAIINVEINGVRHKIDTILAEAKINMRI